MMILLSDVKAPGRMKIVVRTLRLCSKLSGDGLRAWRPLRIAGSGHGKGQGFNSLPAGSEELRLRR